MRRFGMAAWLALSLALMAASAAQAQTTTTATPGTKRELALKLAAQQAGPEMDRLVAQLTNSAVQPLIDIYGRRLETQVPKDKQAKAAEQLNAELKRYGDEVVKIVQGKVTKVSEETLANVYAENFNEEELRQLTTFFASATVKKYQLLTPQLSNAVVQKMVEATRADIQSRAKTFEEAATRIVGADKTKK
jgi:hypothetical protein